MDPKVLVVDGNDSTRKAAFAVLEQESYSVSNVLNGEAALAHVRFDPPDALVVNARLSGIDGLEVCRRLRADLNTRLLPIVLISEDTDRSVRVAALMAGADDALSLPSESAELRARLHSALRLKRYTDDLDSTSSIVISFAQLIEARDRTTEGHCHRLANYATALGRKLGLNSTDLNALYRGGFLHDIGKIVVPDSVLLKNGPLTPEERTLMEQHTVIGEQLCGNMRSLRTVKPIVRWHHERLDGSGYPDGLVGDAIPLLAQIMAIVDVWDALTTNRPYKDALPPEVALAQLYSEVRRGWRDGRLLELFADLVMNERLSRFAPDATAANA